MQAPWQDYGFTPSVLFVVLIVTVFVVVFSAPQWLMMTLLALGLFTALSEHFMRRGG